MPGLASTDYECPSLEFWAPGHIKRSKQLPSQVINKLQTAQTVVFILHYSDEFSTEQHLLDDFECVKIFLVNSTLVGQVSLPPFRLYDLVVFYEGPKYEKCVTGNDAYIRNPDNESCCKEVYDAACLVIDRIITPSIDAKCRLHVTAVAEELIMQVAFINRKYGLKGPKPEFTRYFVSKADMIEKAKLVEHAAPISVSFNVDHNLSPIEMAKKLVNEGLPPYPLFGKPVAGADSDNTRKLDNFEALVNWIDEVANEGEMGFENFIVQEFLDGEFYITQTFVSADGTLHFVSAATSINAWTDIINKVIPAATVFLTEEEQTYQDLRNFSFKFLNTFGARQHPGFYIIEMIRTKENGHFKLLETYSRPDNGGNENRLNELITGIDPELVHLMAPFIDDEYIKSICKHKHQNCRSGFNLWYPNLDGIVAENRTINVKLPKGGQIVMTKHYHSKGDRIYEPVMASDIRCETSVITQTYKDAYKTALDFMQFDPVIVTKDES